MLICLDYAHKFYVGIAEDTEPLKTMSYYRERI